MASNKHLRCRPSPPYIRCNDCNNTIAYDPVNPTNVCSQCGGFASKDEFSPSPSTPAQMEQSAFDNPAVASYSPHGLPPKSYSLAGTELPGTYQLTYDNATNEQYFAGPATQASHGMDSEMEEDNDEFVDAEEEIKSEIESEQNEDHALTEMTDRAEQEIKEEENVDMQDVDAEVKPEPRADEQDELEDGGSLFEQSFGVKANQDKNDESSEDENEEPSSSRYDMGKSSVKPTSKKPIFEADEHDKG